MKVHFPQMFKAKRGFMTGINVDGVSIHEYPKIISRMSVVGIGNMLYGYSPNVTADKVNAIYDLGAKTWVPVYGCPSEWTVDGHGIADRFHSAWAGSVLRQVEGLLLLCKTPPEFIQIWNEVDLYNGVLMHYGLWGNDLIDLYIRLLSVVRKKFPGNIKIATSFAGIKWVPGWALDEISYLVDYVCLHHYEAIQPNCNISADRLREKLDRAAMFFPSNKVWLTETSVLENMLLEEQPDLEMETKCKKAWLLKVLDTVSYYDNIEAVIGYAWGNPWMNCDLRHVANVLEDR